MASSDLTINGLETVEADDIECNFLTVNNDLTVFGNQIFVGNQIVSGNLTVSGNFIGQTANLGTLSVSESAFVGSTMTVSGNLLVNNLDLSGSLTANSAFIGTTMIVSGAIRGNSLNITGSIASNDIFNTNVIDSYATTVDNSYIRDTLYLTNDPLLLPPYATVNWSGLGLYFNANGDYVFQTNGNSELLISSGTAQFNGTLTAVSGASAYEANITTTCSANAFSGIVGNFGTTLSAGYFSGNGGGLTGLSALSISGVIPVNRGGTNTSILTANKVMVGNGSGPVLTPANLHWDNLNLRLGLLTSTPNATIDVAGTLAVSGNVAFASELTVSGIATFGSNVGMSGLVVSNNTILNNLSIQGNILGDVTFGQNISASGLRVSQNAIINGTLNVGGIATFGNQVLISGNVGIGTTNPTNRLTVQNNSGPIIQNNHVGGAVGGALQSAMASYKSTMGVNETFVMRVGSASSNFNHGYLGWNNTAAGSTSNYLTLGVLGAGNVVNVNGAGTVSISGTLNVAGNATFSQNTYIAGNLSVSGSSVINTLTVSGLSVFNSKQRINITQLPDYVGLGRGALAINNGTTGGEAMISVKTNLTLGATYKQWDFGVNDQGKFVIEAHRMDDYISTVAEITANDTTIPATPVMNVYGEVNAQQQATTVSTTLRATTSFNGTNGDIFKAMNTYEGRDAWITIENTNSATPAFENTMRLGVDATGDLCMEDESFRRMLEFNVSGYCKLFDGLAVQANSQAFPGSGGGIGKSLFMRYSTAPGQDQAYIQSINRTNSQLFPLVIQANQMWLNGDRKSSAVVPAGVNVVGTANNFGMTGANMNFYTSADNYPGLSIMNYNHNNIFMGFDMYYDGTNFRAGASTSQYNIYKFNNELLFCYDNVAQGATCNGTDYAMKIQLNGGCVFNYAQTNNVKVNSPYFIANYSGITGIAGFESKIIASAPLATAWISAFNQSDAGTGSRGVIFTRSGTILGSVRYDAGGVAYLTTSDYRVKENVRPYCCGLSMIRRLNPVLYNWKVDGSDGQGFIAHELQEVVPEAVYGEKDRMNEDGTPDLQSVDMTRIIPCMVKAIQQLDSKVETLGGADFSALIEENRILKERLDALEAKLKKAFII